MMDQGGRRSGKERRQFVYSGHIPERRSGRERRSGLDRRSGRDRRAVVVSIAVAKEKRSSTDRRRIPPPYNWING
jgi:hypothetical protein